MFNITSAIAAITPRVLAHYEHLHRHPEPSFEEFETTKYIINELESIGGFKLTQLTKTGVIADIDGGKPGKTVALRADIDCLRMDELNKGPLVSENPGLMHGCGHDAHTAMLLGVAAVISKYKDELPGHYRLLFQPAEETPPGGAIEYVHAHALDGVDYILGQHVMPTVPTGQIGLLPGAMMASSDRFKVIIKGSGGHASQPYMTIDPIAIGAEIITNLQHIVSRETDPLDQLVVSVTQFHGGSTFNVIPSEAMLTGSVRSFSEKMRKHASERIQEVINAVAHLHRAEVEITYTYGYDATINNPDVAKKLRKVILDRYGEGTIPDLTPLMGAEDFSRYLKVVPGAFYFLGVGNKAKGYTYPIHHGCFHVDTDALPIGMEVMLRGGIELAGER